MVVTSQERETVGGVIQDSPCIIRPFFTRHGGYPCLGTGAVDRSGKGKVVVSSGVIKVEVVKGVPKTVLGGLRKWTVVIVREG